jgi:hypothetical protein
VAIEVVDVVVITSVAIGVVDVVVEVVANFMEIVLVREPIKDNNPQETRLPASLCRMKGFPSTSVLSEEAENTKLAPPNESVLL